MFKLWVDDTRLPPSKDWFYVKRVKDAIATIKMYEKNMSGSDTILIDLDHDAGDFAQYGGDYIKILDWLEREGIVDTGYFFHLHTMNPVGRDNMRAVIQKNGWREVF